MVKKLSKTDDVLLELSKSVAAFLQSVFPFQYENKVYRLIDNYVASPYARCDVCGNHPIIEVSVIRSEDGHHLRVGNDCIDNMTGRRVSRWFKNCRSKRENIMSNRRYIDGISEVLKAYEGNELSFKIVYGDVEKLSFALEKMINGLNLDRKEEQTAECYLSTKIRK
jgi:hypothetical protein